VLEWITNACDLVIDFLAELRGIFPNHKGIKSVDDSMLALAEKRPELFGEYLVQATQRTEVIELLQKIKQSNPNITFGRILGRAFARKDVCNVTLPLQLHRITDKELEEMLKDFVEHSN
jgi:hypothetical protein